MAGAQVIGFDIQDRPRAFGMRTVSRLEGGHAPNCARPDVIHASPPCREHTGLRCLGNGPEPEPYTELLQMIIHRLQSYQRERLNLDGVH
eukprot:2413898-Pleurochrysis_carterae.AAC.2